ncbi:MAG: hypothetical protein IPJ65_42225 [Archangiaceae bacterium]|nr:hypothetical protein [Archangiaceae bacterium]
MFRAIVPVVTSRFSPGGKTVTENEFMASVLALHSDGFDVADEILLKQTYASKQLSDGAASLLRKFTPNAP